MPAKVKTAITARTMSHINKMKSILKGHDTAQTADGKVQINLGVEGFKYNSVQRKGLSRTTLDVLY